jgi:hypothetical protein
MKVPMDFHGVSAVKYLAVMLVLLTGCAGVQRGSKNDSVESGILGYAPLPRSGCVVLLPPSREPVKAAIEFIGHFLTREEADTGMHRLLESSRKVRVAETDRYGYFTIDFVPHVVRGWSVLRVTSDGYEPGFMKIPPAGVPIEHPAMRYCITMGSLTRPRYEDVLITLSRSGPGGDSNIAFESSAHAARLPQYGGDPYDRSAEGIKSLRKAVEEIRREMYRHWPLEDQQEIEFSFFT